MAGKTATAGPGIWPREEPRHTQSEAERVVYQALSRALPSGWWAWHSLRLRSPITGEHTETDFLLADPSHPGIIILEVKGGQISQRDGHWFQYERPLERDPLEQALRFRRTLVNCLKQKVKSVPFIAAAACFPDCEFHQAPSQGDLAGLVLGGQDLPYLGDILPDLMKRAVPDPWPADGLWPHKLHHLWGETWVPEMNLGRRVALDAQRRMQLDTEQTRVLDQVQENLRLLILGGAGTGKTILAREAAMRNATNGERTLLLCYTDALAAGLDRAMDHANLTVAPIQRFALQLLEQKGVPCPSNPDANFWADVCLRAAAEAAPDDPWDAVLVDEGQDFAEGDWLLVQECLRHRGKLWIFADQDQAFWPDRVIPDRLRDNAFMVRLSRPYRCPPAIQHLADCYAGRCQPNPALLEEGCKQGQIKVVTSSEAKLAKQVGKEVNRLISDGLKPQDIAVLSLRGRGAMESIVHSPQLGTQPVVSATDPEATSRVVCDTFLRFKGLERSAVIVTDLRLVDGDHSRRMHIAVSRATSTLRVVGTKEYLDQESVLSTIF